MDQARRQRAPLPSVIAEAPELWPGSRMYYDAFIALSSCRPIGMAAGRIPWTAVADYADRKHMRGIESEILWWIIAEMDGAYLKKINEKQQSSAPGQPKPLKSAKHTNR